MQATQEGLVPLKAWVKSALDLVIQVCMAEPGLEFVWVGDDAVDPLEQAQTLKSWSARGSRRARRQGRSWGSGGEGKAETGPQGLGKYNPYHDQAGRFTTADISVEPRGRTRSQRRPIGVQVASNGAVLPDDQVGRPGRDVSQIIEPEPPPLEPPEPPEAPNPAAPTGTVVDVVAPHGELPGVADKLGNARTMPASDDPASEAEAYMDRLTTGKTHERIKSELDQAGGRVIKLSDGTYITYRPPGVSGSDTLPTTASMDINGPQINSMNNGKI